MQLPRDVWRLIMIMLPCEDLPTLVKLARVFRSIIKEKLFWADKAKYQFPGLIRGYHDILQYQGPGYRMRYLDIYFHVYPFDEKVRAYVIQQRRNGSVCT